MTLKLRNIASGDASYVIINQPPQLENMDSEKSKYRKVNATLGKQPSIGPFPADQLVPWAIICGGSYYLAHGLLRLNWVWTISIATWGISTWWVLTANGAWRILSKFVSTPNWTRIGIPYQQLVNTINKKAHSNKTYRK